MIVENGQVKLEKGEKAFKCVYLGREVKIGNRKSDNAPYSFSTHSFHLVLKNKDGQEYKKSVEALMDANYNPGLQEYKDALVVYAIKNPLDKPVVVGFVPMPQSQAVVPTAPTSVPNPAPTDLGEPLQNEELPF